MLNEIYKSQLSKSEQKIYDFIKQELISNKDRILIKGNVSSSSIFDINSALDDDCPELYYAHLKTTKCLIVPDGIILNFSRKLSYENQQLEWNINKILYEININRNDSDLVKYKKIHNWMIRNVNYSKIVSINHDYYSNNYAITGPFLEKEAVCQGISKGYQHLCHLNGLECSILRGQVLNTLTNNQENHCWNLVKLKNNIQHVDVTWDLAFSKVSKYNRYDYFLFSDKEANDRIFNPIVNCPEINRDYFHFRNLIFKNKKNLYKYLDYKVKCKSKVFYFKFDSNSFNLNDVEMDILNYLSNKLRNNKIISVSNKPKGIFFIRVLNNSVHSLY